MGEEYLTDPALLLAKLQLLTVTSVLAFSSSAPPSCVGKQKHRKEISISTPRRNKKGR